MRPVGASHLQGMGLAGEHAGQGCLPRRCVPGRGRSAMPPLRPTRRVLLAGGLGTLAARTAPSPAAVAAPGQAPSPAAGSIPLHLAGPTGPDLSSGKGVRPRDAAMAAGGAERALKARTAGARWTPSRCPRRTPRRPGAEVEFPDGRVVLSRPGGDDDVRRRAVAVRAADLRFVLDCLAVRNRGGNPDAGRRGGSGRHGPGFAGAGRCRPGRRLVRAGPSARARPAVPADGHGGPRQPEQGRVPGVFWENLPGWRRCLRLAPGCPCGSA